MNNQLSIYLDLLRFISALLVFISHVTSFAGDWLWQLGGLAHEAVVFFFVLSGFVIAFVCFDKKEGAFEYAVNRLARIYSVAIPALLLTLALYNLGHIVNVGAFINLDRNLTDPVLTLVSALFFFNQSWNGITVFSNLPYWSLGYEVLYYLLFGVAIFTTGYKRYLFAMLVMALMGPSILLYLPIWLLGVYCFKCIAKHNPSLLITAILFSISIMGVGLLSFEATQNAINAYLHDILGDGFYGMLLEPADKFGSDYLLALLVALHIFSCAKISDKYQLFDKSIGKRIRIMSSHTFSLYLYHMPMLYFTGAVVPYSKFPLFNLIACWIIIPAVILYLSNLTEKSKDCYKYFFASVINKMQRLKAAHPSEQ